MDLRLIVYIVCLLLLVLLVRVVINIWWIPHRLKSYFESQGVFGPPYKLLYGNTNQIIQMMMTANSSSMDLTHHILPRVLPEIYSWTKLYGKNFVYWFGPTPRIVIPQPELIREVLCDKSGSFEKPEIPIQLRQLSGDGLANSRGGKWARQRRLITPAFHLETLKIINFMVTSFNTRQAMVVPVVVGSTASMLQRWSHRISSGSQEIEVGDEFRNLTADIIAKTAFGSSFEEGKHIFDLQTHQAILAAESFRKFNIPGYRFLPTRSNLKAQKIDSEIQRALSRIIMSREKNAGAENEKSDLLGTIMMDGNGGRKHEMSYQEMIDECKTLFVAGHETTAILLVWSIILLAMDTHWQDKARQEVLHFCNNDDPNADALTRLKIVNMILQEVLRLYPPLPFMIRKTRKMTKLGRFVLPKGTEISIPIAALHHDEELWGEDAKEFNPWRFQGGVSKAANHQAAFMPFGLGPRICVGMNFSLIESKVVLSMILQRFSWTLSPAYVHAPAQNFTIRPQHGAQIIFNKVPFNE